MGFDDVERGLGPGRGHELLVISSRRIGDRAVIELAGELDLAGKGLLMAAAQTVLQEPPRPDGLDIDATRLEFIDSAGLATLLQIREQATLASVTFHVREASPEFLRVVDLAGLNSLLSTTPRLDG